VGTQSNRTRVLAAATALMTGAAIIGTVSPAAAASIVTGPDAVAAIERAGGRVVDRNDAVGMYRVLGPQTGFVERADAAPALSGAAHSIPIGYAPGAKPEAAQQEAGPTVEPDHRGRPAPGMDPLDDKLWGLRMVKADQARRITIGDHRVTVGVLDTGVDASNPDIAPNFNWKLSRNFAPDIPAIDGPCEVATCVDAVGTDDDGHGTHVAGTIGAAANGVGVSGVAPGVSLVELKGGQDSGFFFLESVVNALTYAGRNGIDVINMSFYVDPWLYNCAANPADSPAAQAEQRTIILGMVRALTYAHVHGVTLVGALGNNHEDLGSPRTDTTSPDYPAGTTYPRPIDNRSCLDLPVEGPFVIGVSALGPSGRKADYSNYGTEQISVAAPGGWFRDGLGTPTYRTNENEILSTYPKKVLQEQKLVDADGNVTPAGVGLVYKECTEDGRCGYYTYLQGTSMASPHAAGVAALIVSRYGHRDRAHPGTVTLAPTTVEWILTRTAAEHACPDPRLQTYVPEGRSTEFDAYCAGGTHFNGFYGAGIVDAYAAVRGR
jgi:subtilisin family serine protease